MKTKLFTLITFILISFFFKTAHAERLVIPGTGACESVLNELAEAFNKQNKDDEIIIPSSIGSSGGIASVIEDKSIIARVARPLKKKEAGYGLDYLAFARDAVVFAVGSAVQVNTFSTGRLVDIFTGKIKNWKEAGGGGRRIRVLIREPGDSSRDIIQKNIDAFKHIVFSNRSKMLYHNYEMVNMLKKYKGSIGWLTRSSLVKEKKFIKPVTIDNVEPNHENIMSGKYKLTGDHAFVYRRKRLNEPARKFLDFVFSETGSQILKDNGLVPLSRR